MDVRCGKCNKPFRVPDEKIFGKGITFTCTRCNASIIITQEEFEQYKITNKGVTSPPVPGEPWREPAAARQKPERTEADRQKADSVAYSDASPPLERAAPAAGPGELPVLPAPSEDSFLLDLGFGEEYEPVAEPQPVQAPKVERIEVRCCKCEKRFIVPADKIIGTGVKFACTRCGEYLKITKEACDLYLHSTKTSPVGGVTELKPEIDTDTVPAKGQEPMPNTKAPLNEPGGPDISLSTVSESSPEQQYPALPEPVPPVDTAHTTEPVQPPEPAFLSDLARAFETELKREPRPEPPPEPQQADAPTPILKPEPDPMPVRKTALPAVVIPTQATAALPEQSLPASVQKKDAARPVPARTTNTMHETPRSRSNMMLVAYIVALVVICLGAYGVFVHLRPSARHAQENHVVATIESLRLVSIMGSLENNGDLLITGVIENAAEKEKPDWFLVVDVYNSQGQELSKIRLLNGKQLYTKRDYEILSLRGVNIQDLKEKSRDNQGISIPSKGTVTFEMRYMQPPAGVANFNATIRPFDPISLYKDLAEDTR
jgi:zinc-ribbon domain